MRKTQWDTEILPDSCLRDNSYDVYGLGYRGIKLIKRWCYDINSKFYVWFLSNTCKFKPWDVYSHDCLQKYPKPFIYIWSWLLQFIPFIFGKMFWTLMSFDWSAIALQGGISATDAILLQSRSEAFSYGTHWPLSCRGSHYMQNKFRGFERQRTQLKTNSAITNDELLDLQSRRMKDNLVFDIPENQIKYKRNSVNQYLFPTTLFRNYQW